MPGPSPDTHQIALEERREQDSVATEDRLYLKFALDDTSSRGRATPFVSSIKKDEPIVTRSELWSYYCQPSLPILSTSMVSPPNFFQKFTTMEIMYSSLFSLLDLFRLKDRSNEGSWATWIFFYSVPIASHCSRIWPRPRPRIIMHCQRCVWRMCRSLGRRHKIRL